MPGPRASRYDELVRIRVNRDSVSAGDDIEDHERLLDVTDVAEADTLDALVAGVLRLYPLPLVSGGKATWCLASRRPIAIVAQQWPSPRIVPRQARSIADCKRVDGALRLHIAYLAQVDPDVALEVLQRVRLDD